MNRLHFPWRIGGPTGALMTRGGGVRAFRDKAIGAGEAFSCNYYNHIAKRRGRLYLNTARSLNRCGLWEAGLIKKE